MASNQRIDDLISEKAFQQLDRLVDRLGIATAKFDDASRAAANVNNTVANSNSLRTLNTSTQQAATSLGNLSTAEENVVQATKAVETETRNVTQLLNQFGGSLDQNIRRQVQLKTELAGVRQQLKDLERQYAGSAQSQQRLTATTAGLTRREVELKEALRQNGVAIRQQLRDNLAAGTSSDQLAARLDSLRRVYRSLTEEERINAQVGGVLQASISQTSDQIKKLDAKQGVFSRNVGNYLQQAFGGIRQLAYILPGIGIAGIFGLIIEGATELYQRLIKAGDGGSLLRDKMADLNAIFKESNREAGLQISNLRILYTAATDVTNSIENRTKAAKELQEQFPETFKNSEILAILNGKEKDSYETLTKSILENARAKAIAAKLGDIESQILDVDIQEEKIRIANANEKKRETQRVSTNKRAIAINKDFVKQTSESFARESDLRAKNALDEQESNRKRLIQRREFLTNFVGNNEIARTLSGGDTATPKTNNSDFSNRLAIEKENLESILNNEKTTYEERLKAIEDFEAQSLAIIAAGESKKVFTALEATKLRKSVENDANKELLDVNKKAADEAIKQLREFGKLIDQGLDNRLKATKAAGDQELADLAKNTQEQLNILSERYRKGELTEEQYQAERLNITGRYDELVLQSQIDNLKKLNNVRDDDANADAERNKQAADLEIRLNKLINDRKIANDEKYAQTRLRLLKQIRDAEFKLGQEIIELGETLVNASFERANQELEAQSEKLNIDKENELEAVERSVGSEEEKQARVALINEKYAQQQANLEKKQSEIRIRQAKFEKGFRALQVAINTFQKVAEIQAIAAVLLANPFTAALAPIALAQIPFVIGSGAAQAAAILATPLPAYKDGVRNKPTSGLAIYGEAGTEYVKEPGKPGYFTTQPTLGYLPAGTDVISNKDLVRMLAKPDPIQYVGGQKVDMSKVVGELQQTRKAIQSQQISQTIITKRGFTKQQIKVDKAQAYKRNRFN